MGKGLNDFLIQTGSQAVQTGTNGVVSGLVNRLFAKSDDRRQMRQQTKLQNLQIAGNKEMMDYGKAKDLEMWKETSYPAQMEQLKKAGLNPALLYGMGGGGGTTVGGSGGGVSGTGAAMTGTQGTAQTGMGLMQMKLMDAQIDNMKADSELKRADATKTAGVDTELGKTQIASLTQGITNQKAQETLTRVQTEVEQVKASVARQTINEQMKAWENIAAKGTEEIRELRLANDLSYDQYKDKIQLLKNQVATESIRAALMKAQKENTEQDTKNKIQEILESEQRIKTMAGQLMIQWEHVRISSSDAIGKEHEMMGLNKEGWEFIKDVVPNMLIPIGKGFPKTGQTPVTGFHQR